MYTGEKVEKDSDIDWEDPFFAAVKRGEQAQYDATLAPPAPPVPDRTTTTDYEIDQHTTV